MTIDATRRTRFSRQSSVGDHVGGATPALVIYASYDPGQIGRRIELEDETTIGRSDDNTIVVLADTVSRSHARISRRNRSWMLIDSGSANGTFLRDEPVTEATLRPNDLFKIGPAIFKFLQGDVEAEYHEAIHQLAITDGLTGVANRRAFDDTIAAEVRRASRYTRPLSLILFDLDHFKQVNDKHGHMAGDLVLATTAGLVRATARTEDLVARYGGEEFAIVLPETPLSAAAGVAENVRAAVQGHRFVHEDRIIPVTVSLGVAELATAANAGALIRAADEKLYEAKRSGRNRVVS